ncbi:cytosol nonspecific dipeptidase [Hahella sp. CCB-MM4]|uniref:aminoacyl-histidine dipeptidase n=1 Tax=Hahella sp. (strain CCB-MM4) TaxID=1926491 RepID=UPI000B9AB489|nr:aminoacyl-histidine dipeptidase [Hahella sp. CCB-MM4]OZG74671.1 cytosol nonspecific dipeptidase [Hahella sp. CCB-MM4]
MSIAELEPKALWENFQLLCDTPRPSNEEAELKRRIREKLADFPVTIDEDAVGNLILRKAATPGYESAPGVVLQSHLDMVAQQNEGTGHNFSTDPIKAYVDGEWVTASGTTLGADNGIGVAAILAVMTSGEIVHGPLEAVLTINEEAGMTGAKGLQPGVIKGKLLLNLDTEEEGELYIGCAGGVDVTAVLPFELQAAEPDLSYLHISVKGLRGGHSGIDIHRGRGNALKLVARVTTALQKELNGVRLASLTGGSLRNAIPREAFANVAVLPADVDRVNAMVAELQALFIQELGSVEPHISLAVEPCEPQSLLEDALAQRLLDTIAACPHGVFRMSADFDGVTETSNNLASVTIDENHIKLECLTRSLKNSSRDEAAESVAALFRLAGAEVAIDDPYPGWAPNKDSHLLATLSGLHQEVMGFEPKIQVIHAGLECGILGANYPDWDMISFGPTIRGAHSPDEAVHVKSVASFWEFLMAALKHLATA